MMLEHDDDAAVPDVRDVEKGTSRRRRRRIYYWESGFAAVEAGDGNADEDGLCLIQNTSKQAKPRDGIQKRRSRICYDSNVEDDAGGEGDEGEYKKSAEKYMPQHVQEDSGEKRPQNNESFAPI